MKSVYLYGMICAVVICQFFTNGLAHAAIINVPADFVTIQAAVDSATPGDTVKVSAGAYFETVIMKDNVNLEGAGSGVTSILSTAGFAVQASNNATLSGFTITNNVSTGVLSDGVNSTITKCLITKNRGDKEQKACPMIFS